MTNARTTPNTNFDLRKWSAMPTPQIRQTAITALVKDKVNPIQDKTKQVLTQRLGPLIVRDHKKVNVIGMIRRYVNANGLDTM